MIDILIDAKIYHGSLVGPVVIKQFSKKPTKDIIK
jgi:hypothetical protein